jgi:hypothetical protein
MRTNAVAAPALVAADVLALATRSAYPRNITSAGGMLGRGVSSQIWRNGLCSGHRAAFNGPWRRTGFVAQSCLHSTDRDTRKEFGLIVIGDGTARPVPSRQMGRENVEFLTAAWSPALVQVSSRGTCDELAYDRTASRNCAASLCSIVRALSQSLRRTC